MIRIAIIEDNVAYRKALETLITKTADMEIVYAASDCTNLSQTIANILPDVVIMDIDMPGLTGIEGVKLVKGSSPNTNIFMLTVFEDDQNIFESIKAGATGYLLKKDPPAEILGAIRKVHNGEAIMNGKVARKVLKYYSEKPAPKENFTEYNLTNREKELLELIIKGLSYKEIAAKCFISIETVFSHIRSIYSKLNVHSRSEISARFG